MVRVAGLKRRQSIGLAVRSPDGLTIREQLELITARTQELVQRHADVFIDDVAPRLEDAGIRIVHWEDLDDAERDRLREYFRDQVFPVLTPLAVDPAHPFPYISGLSLNLAVLGARPRRPAPPRFARVKVPNNVPRFVHGAGPARRTATLPAARGPHRRAPRPALPGPGGRRPPPVPGHPQRRPRGRGGPRRGPAAGAGARAGPPPVRPRGAAGGHRHRWTRRSSRCCSRSWRSTPGRRRSHVPGPARPGRRSGRSTTWTGRSSRTTPFVPATHPRLVGGRDAQERVRHPARGRRAGAPPVRLVRHQRAAVHRAGRRRPERAGDQADAVPHLRRLPDRRRAHRRGRGRQAGRRARRDQGPVRRGGQHHAGPGRWSAPAATSSTAWSG